MSEKIVRFTEDRVRDWCSQNDNERTGEAVFGERVVPGLMLLDSLSGMVSALGNDDEEVILAGVTAARFRDPVLIGESVKFTISDFERGENFSTVEFEARVEDRSSLVATGALSVVLH